MSEPQSRDALLMLCDISGYTRFVTTNHETLAHSYVIILELMQALTKQVRVPFEIAKLEGDAVFLFCWLPDDVAQRRRTMDRVLQLIQEMFAAYDTRLEELKATNICTCEACVTAQELDLKIIAHQGPILMHQIGKFSELSGVDVILAHRLLKNSLSLNRYVLFTQAVHELAMGATMAMAWQEGTETYENLGTTRTFTYVPPLCLRTRPDGGSAPVTLWQKTAAILLKIGKARALQFGLIHKPLFHHVPGEAPTSR